MPSRDAGGGSRIEADHRSDLEEHMRSPTHRRAAWLFAAVLALAGTAAAGPASAAAPGGCATIAIDGMASCQFTAGPAATDPTGAGYGPAELRDAYGLQSTIAGARQTVAVVAAYDDPNAEADLAVYRNTYAGVGLTPCTTANGCFRKVGPTGSAAALPAANAAWAAVAATDLDVVSAICPNCHLILVEAASPAITDMGTAVNAAVALGAKFVDIGWSQPEAAADTGYDATYFTHTGVALVAPAAQALPGGSSGVGLVGYPASSPQVTAVGGTTLTATGTGLRRWSEAAWPLTGSGCSAYEPKPSRQTDAGCARRTVNDVAADADPDVGSGAVAAYDSYGDDTYAAPGWTATGGTTVAAAIVTAVYALTGTPAAGTYPASYPYSHFHGLNDLGAAGYDQPTGMGSPQFTMAFDYSGAHTGAIYSGVLDKCITDNQMATANGTPINIYTCKGGANQIWTMHADGTIQVYGKCLDLTGAGIANGTPAELYTCVYAPNQIWQARADGELVNPVSGRCLTDPGNNTTDNTRLQLSDCNGSPGQVWATPYGTPAGSGQIVAGVNANLCLDDFQQGTADNNPIDIYTCNSGIAQQWSVTGSGTLQVRGKCLDVNRAGTADGTAVDLYTCTGGGNQQWLVRADGSLLNPESGKCLADPNDSTKLGTPVQLSTCTGTPGQLWRYP
jgi:hypothetical protein